MASDGGTDRLGPPAREGAALASEVPRLQHVYSMSVWTLAFVDGALERQWRDCLLPLRKNTERTALRLWAIQARPRDGVWLAVAPVQPSGARTAAWQD